MLEVPGVEIFFFGPADYSSTAGFAGQWEGPGVAETIFAVREKIAASGKFSGVIAAGNRKSWFCESRKAFRCSASGSTASLMMRGAIRGAVGMAQAARAASAAIRLVIANRS